MFLLVPELLQTWPLFGSTFFYIERVSEQSIPSLGVGELGGECLLAIGRAGLRFLHIETHETRAEFRLSQVLSTNRVSGPNNDQRLEIKLGSMLTQQRVLTLHTDKVL